MRRFIGKCPDCGSGVSVSRSELLGAVEVRHCGRSIAVLRPVVGRVGKLPCDSRCTTAMQQQCACQCNGDNHGIEHLWKASA